MAKFELSIYDLKTGEVAKTYKQNKMPVILFLKFQELSEKVTGGKIGSDADMFKALKPLFLETFPELTEKEYLNNADVSEVIFLFNEILQKSTLRISEETSKNA